MARRSNFVKLAGLLAGVRLLIWLAFGFFFWFDLLFGLGVFQEKTWQTQRERCNPQRSFNKILREYTVLVRCDAVYHIAPCALFCLLWVFVVFSDITNMSMI